MISGIYVLRFSNDTFYIGKSNDIYRRWKEHDTKFQKGTAAAKMQQCFNECGYPKKEILIEIHPEHIDVIEPILIHNNWNENILNTSRDKPPSDMRDEYLELCKLSLGELCKRIIEAEEQIETLEADQEDINTEHSIELSRIKYGTALEKAEDDLKRLKLNRDILSEQNIELQREIRELKKPRSFFQKLGSLF